MNNKIKALIGIMGLGGSYLGLAVTLQYAVAANTIASFVICFIFSLAYAIGIFVSYKLLTDDSYETYKLNTCFWLIQIPAISSAAITYLFTSGGNLLLGVNLNKIGIAFNFQFGSKFELYILNFDKPFIIYVNFVALIFSWWLYNSTAKIKNFSLTNRQEASETSHKDL